jgi:hypothetical protein
MAKYTDYTGTVFGKLTVLKMLPSRNKNSYCLCKCECGNIKEICLTSLKYGTTKTCGCGRTKDYTGQRFGKLTVIKMVKNVNRKGFSCLCKCECGNEKIIRTDALLKGKTTSCGCYSKEIAHQKAVTHNLSYSRIYRLYRNIIQRCTNPNSELFHCYGGKGIKIGEDFNTFEKFYEWSMNNGYSDNKQIHRIDSNKDYTANNCVWMDKLEHIRLHARLKRKKVAQIDPKTNEIVKIFDSVTLAREQIGSGIEKALKDPNLIRYGFKWQYID